MNKICCAYADIRGSEKYKKICGKVNFSNFRAGVFVRAEIFNLPEEKDIFAFHIHEGSICSGKADDPFSEAKGHFNPSEKMHPYHAGDMPPLFGNHGYVCMSFYTDRFKINDIIGKTIIIHRSYDDFSKQPSGNSGEKIACGKILFCK